jgi:hypothetical protein
MVKLEERGDHHRPTRIEIGGVASPTAYLRHASMALTMV